MFVQCPECNHHYDDRQGVHQCQTVHHMSPIMEHITNTRAAWSGYPPPAPVGGGRQRPGNGVTTYADTSGDQSPIGPRSDA